MLNADDRRVFSSRDGADMRERVSDLLRRGRPNDANVMLEKLYKCDSRLATDAAAEIVDTGWATANTAIMLLKDDSPRARRPLQAMTNSDAWSDRLWVARVGIVETDWQRVAQLVHDPEPRVARRAILSLGRARTLAALPTLISALDSSNAGVRRACSAALLKVGDPSAVEPILRAAEGESQVVRTLMKMRARRLRRGTNDQE